MARVESSASAHPPTREGRRCEVCGVSSHVRSLVGLRNDRRRNGPRFCLSHHPDSLAGSVQTFAFVGAL
jgi:hypothetical protein